MNSTVNTIYNTVVPFEIRTSIYQKTKVKSYKKDRDLGKGDKLLKRYDEYQCIFVHIPKNAGRSIKKTIFNCYSLGHLTINDFKIIYNRQTFERYFKFAFVRNPWDRLLSTYLFLKQGGCTNRDRQWAEKNLSDYDDFNIFVRDWLNFKNIYTQIHFIPQYVFVCDRNFNLQVDYIGRFENVDRDFINIQQKLGFELQLQHVNRSSNKKRNYRNYYNQESIDKVAKIYSKDIALFEYNF